jgi:hypothetical protein
VILAIQHSGKRTNVKGAVTTSDSVQSPDTPPESHATGSMGQDPVENLDRKIKKLGGTPGWVQDNL